MRKNSLVSNYTVAQYKVHKDTCNQADTPNIVDRDFDNREKYSISAICEFLEVSRSLVYYHLNKKPNALSKEEEIIE